MLNWLLIVVDSQWLIMVDYEDKSQYEPTMVHNNFGHMTCQGEEREMSKKFGKRRQKKLETKFWFQTTLKSANNPQFPKNVAVAGRIFPDLHRVSQPGQTATQWVQGSGVASFCVSTKRGWLQMTSFIPQGPEHCLCGYTRLEGSWESSDRHDEIKSRSGCCKTTLAKAWGRIKCELCKPTRVASHA